MAGGSGEVRRIAKLARLRLSSEEEALYQGQFARILEFFAQLSGVEDAAAASNIQKPCVTREDVPRPFLNPEGLLRQAPDQEGGYYKVKKVME